jgi:creatinine amidohydrolase
VELAGATWTDLEPAARRLLVLPLGSLEQHGPHLPLDTDTRIAAAVSAGLADARPDVALAPVIAFGASGEHAAFPGTLVVGHPVLCDLVTELVRSARHAFGGVVVVNAHGGNAEALGQVRTRAAHEGDDVLVWQVAPEGGDAHAGRTETSLMLAIDAGAVRLERAQPGCTEPLASLLPRLRAEGVRPVSSNGVLGDPTGATAEEGCAILGDLVTSLTAAVSTRWPAP